MEPMRVTIHLIAPMCCPPHPIHLDGVLSAMRVARAQRDGAADAWAFEHDLPLERMQSRSGQWVFKAGILRGEPIMAPHTMLMTSKFSPARVAEHLSANLFETGQTRINPAGGHFKSSILTESVQWFSALRADAVGDLRAVSELLADLQFLGARRSLGMGRVSHVLVEPCEEACWQDRALPTDALAEAAGEVVLTHGALRAPYWRRTDHQAILLPIDP